MKSYPIIKIFSTFACCILCLMHMACNEDPLADNHVGVPDGIIAEMYSDMDALSAVLSNRGINSSLLSECKVELMHRQLMRALSTPLSPSDKFLAVRQYGATRLEDISEMKYFPFIHPQVQTSEDIYIHQCVMDLYRIIKVADSLKEELKDDSAIEYSLRITIGRAIASIEIIESAGYDTVQIIEHYTGSDFTLFGYDKNTEMKNVVANILANKRGYDYAYGYRPYYRGDRQTIDPE